MTDNPDRINQLLEKLENLVAKQESFSREVSELKEEIVKLKTAETIVTKNEIKDDNLIEENFELKTPEQTSEINLQQKELVKEPQQYSAPEPKKSPKIKSNIEKFIGENLINKIGIAITVIGVSIGAKYTIEHDLISPLTRIILGYLVGLGLLGFGIKLKSKYESYSAVLVSGAVAILYFITYAAYGFYSLIPQSLTFILMLFFTVFAVIAALNYSRQVIAIIGLVGAYAVPFLLSEGSENIVFLFSYTAIINIGILIIAVKKYWKPLFYSSFILTWLIYFVWYVADFRMSDDLSTALTFLSIFFVIFYLTFISYKILKSEKLGIENIILLLSNSFIFFGIGYSILSNHKLGAQLLGLFTLCNAIVHFIVSVVIYKQKLADRNLFYFVIGLVLVFITISIPIQLDGNWVTLLWAGEAVLLFWIGRTKGVSIYEKLSYPLVLLAFFSIIQDWAVAYGSHNIESLGNNITPVFNIYFLTSLLVIVAFGFINLLNNNKSYKSAFVDKKGLYKIASYALPVVFLITLYFAIRMELSTYWAQLYNDSRLEIIVENQDYPDFFNNYNLLKFKIVWIINYSILFFSILSFVNLKKLKNAHLGYISLGLNVLAIVVFLTQGLYVLSGLRESYIDQSLSEYYQIGVINIAIRYVSFVFVAMLLFVCYEIIRARFLKVNLRMAFDFTFHISILWILSSELISWMDLADSNESYKLGLSIFWGLYSLQLIGLGIWKKKKYLRIGAFALFGATLLKLFFYDISQLNTISKTIVFVSLGILLLIISFLYNKYKHIISNEIES